jgi:hypothetical protein
MILHKAMLYIDLEKKTIQNIYNSFWENKRGRIETRLMGNF